MSETKQQVPAKISHNSNQKEIEVNSSTFCLCNDTNNILFAVFCYAFQKHWPKLPPLLEAVWMHGVVMPVVSAKILFTESLCKYCGLRKQPKFCKATAGFPDTYLPTPRVQKPGDILKSLHCMNIIFDNVSIIFKNHLKAFQMFPTSRTARKKTAPTFYHVLFNLIGWFLTNYNNHSLNI